MASSLVFITGATGFIGSHVVAQNLEAGHRVRLSVRKESQIDGLKSLYSRYVDSIEFLVVPDLSTSDAFKSALQNVVYIFHLASPMPGKGSDFKTDYLLPAEQGTISLLNAARATSTVKRVVITSSVLALLPPDAFVTGRFNTKGSSYDFGTLPATRF